MKRAKLAEILRREYVQTALMVVITVISVVAFWCGLRFAFKTEHPLLAVASRSMEPVLYKGDLILVQGVQNTCEIYAAPKDASPPGDIIIFSRPTYPNDLIVHRAIKKINGTDGSYLFITQGDANFGSDPWEVSDVVGKYTGVKVPLLGYISLFFEPFEIKVAFIMLWIILLMIMQFIPFSRKKVKEEQAQTKPL